MMEPQPPTNVAGEDDKNKAESQVENKSELDHGATDVVSLDDDVLPIPKPFPEAEKCAQKPNGGVQKEEPKIDSNNDNTNVAAAADDDEKSQSPLNVATATATTNSGSSTPGKAKKSVHWSEELVTKSPSPDSSSAFAAGMGSAFDDEYGSNNPYVARSPAPPNSFNLKNTVSNVRDVLGRWGKMVGEATRKAEDLAGNTWQHLKTSPSLADAALGRIAQGTKILAEGGSENIFRQTFETVPEEQLQNSYACYLSTSAGPIMGVLYVSTEKLAFCSDNPLSYKADDRTEWSYYKVVIPLHQLKAVNPSSSRTNSSEKYIQIISVDNHEFWYMGFLNYEGAGKCLQEALQANNV